MEHINSTASRQLTPSQSMRALEKACMHADQRVAMKKQITCGSTLHFKLLALTPLTIYFMYTWFHPGGAYQNNKSSAGIYLYTTQSFLYRPKSPMEIWRPEIWLMESSPQLIAYSKRIAKQKKDGEAKEGVHHPSTWF